MDGGPWWAKVLGVSKSRLSDFMLTIPLCICTAASLSIHLGCFRVLAVVNSAAVNNGIHVSFQFWFPRVYAQRRQWHPTPVLLPGKSHGWRSPWGCSPWGRWGSDNWATSLSLFTFMHWRRKWQPTPMFLPVESQGRGSLVGCHLWCHTESDTTEAT